MQPKAQPYEELDRNLVIEHSVAETDVVYYNVRQAPFSLYNFCNPFDGEPLRRMPDDVAQVSAGVRGLCQESAGGRVRFSTDSPYIAIRVEYAMVCHASHISMLAGTGFDLYEDCENVSIYRRSFVPPYTVTDGFEQSKPIYGEKKMRYFTLHFPTHSRIRNLWIGVADGSVLGEEKPYGDSKAIAVYGSSIVHGTGVARPGLVYTNQLCRMLNRNVENYGFSGQCKGELPIVEWIAQKELSAFVCDYDHNAPTPEHLEATHRPVYECVRKYHPDIPYLMITKPDIGPEFHESDKKRRDIIYDTYLYARSLGDKNVWFIDGVSFFQANASFDCTIDGIHPNDYGNILMAQDIGATLKLAFTNQQ